MFGRNHSRNSNYLSYPRFYGALLGSKLNVQIFFILSFETRLFVKNYFLIATPVACLFAIVVCPVMTINEDYFFFAFFEVNGVLLALLNLSLVALCAEMS
jgi:hypothetical protein